MRPYHSFLRTSLALLTGASLGACGRPAADETRGTDPPPPTESSEAGSADLTHAAAQLAAFLGGRGTLADVQLADTVTLYVAPEGGGGNRSLPREQLRDPAQWVIRTDAGSYSFVPPEGYTELTTRAGRHMRCMEQPLEEISAELARLPHVGTMLQPPAAASCLQSWNVTFVFDETARLVAAVYDQWEW